jgi:hypothetical protein
MEQWILSEHIRVRIVVVSIFDLDHINSTDDRLQFRISKIDGRGRRAVDEDVPVR